MKIRIFGTIYKTIKIENRPPAAGNRLPDTDCFLLTLEVCGPGSTLHDKSLIFLWITPANAREAQAGNTWAI